MPEELSLRARIITAPLIRYNDDLRTYDTWAIYDSGPRTSKVRVIRLQGRIIPTLSLRARIQRRQGWPIPDTGDPGYAIFTNTALGVRTSILNNPIRHTATFTSICRIDSKRLQSLTSQARIVAASTLSMRARIKPVNWSTQASLSFDVRQVASKQARMLFYVPGLYKVPSISMQARIKWQATVRATCHFLVPLPSLGSYIVIEDPVAEGQMTHTLSMKARIQR